MPNFESLRPAPSREATWPWGGSDLSNLRYFKSQLSKWQRMSNACHFHNEMHKTSTAFLFWSTLRPYVSSMLLSRQTHDSIVWLQALPTLSTPAKYILHSQRLALYHEVPPWPMKYRGLSKPKIRTGFILMLDTACRMLNRSSKTYNSLLCHHCNGPNCKSESVLKDAAFCSGYDHELNQMIKKGMHNNLDKDM